MKVTGVDGKQVGKLAGRVYFVNHGVNVSREYSGSVSNPNTAAQVGQRSRFKLASQVSAALSSVIVIPRKGIQSPRNLFVKKNMGLFYGSPQGAQVSYENLQITNGSMGLPGLVVERQSPDILQIQLEKGVEGAYDRIVYNVFSKTAEAQLLLVSSSVVPVTTENNTARFRSTDPYTELVVYAYGLKDKNERARANYNSYSVNTGEDLAKLFANRSLGIGDYFFSQTRGTTLPYGTSTSPVPDEGKVLMYISTLGTGSVKITVGAENPVTLTNGSIQVPYNSNVQLEAIDGAEAVTGTWEFVGWLNNGEQNWFSRENNITLNVKSMKDIVAQFGINAGDGGLE